MGKPGHNNFSNMRCRRGATLQYVCFRFMFRHRTITTVGNEMNRSRGAAAPFNGRELYLSPSRRSPGSARCDWVEWCLEFEPRSDEPRSVTMAAWLSYCYRLSKHLSNAPCLSVSVSAFTSVTRNSCYVSPSHAPRRSSRRRTRPIDCWSNSCRSARDLAG